MKNKLRCSERVMIARRAVSLALVSVAIVFALIYAARRLHILAWFATNTEATSDGMTVVASMTGYDLLVDRTTEYDQLVGGDPKYDGVDLIKNTLRGTGYEYDLTEFSTENADKLAYELVSEVALREEGVDYYSLMPGSCGTMTFYLKPKQATADAQLQLSIGCFASEYVEDTLVTIEVENQTVLDLLRGHILFFTERRGNTPAEYQYNGLMEDGMFTFNTSEHDLCTKPGKTDCYEITLYWEWVLTYYDILDHTGAAAWDDKYPPELAAFVTSSPECFFAVNQNETDPEKLSDGYNDGDQTIGENANFIVAFVTPH